MKIYIPKHLRDIELINRLYKMIIEQSKQDEGSKDSFSDYQWSLSNDPVKRFIDLCLPKDLVDRQDTINYLSALFYSVKGTYKVFDHLIYHNLIDSSRSRITYTAREIKIEISKIGVNKEIFCSALEDFLEALLYFESLKIYIDDIDLEMTGNLTTQLNHGEVYYQHYEAVVDND